MSNAPDIWTLPRDQRIGACTLYSDRFSVHVEGYELRRPFDVRASIRHLPNPGIRIYAAFDWRATLRHELAHLVMWDYYHGPADVSEWREETVANLMGLAAHAIPEMLYHLTPSFQSAMDAVVQKDRDELHRYVAPGEREGESGPVDGSGRPSPTPVQARIIADTAFPAEGLVR